mmetsp:Transcript_52532/g.155066  ORF Transcript_52532/g.155066 Transcript_52532/m.155066 type:complete len:226 (+) Transcript_52532:284-961(+)
MMGRARWRRRSAKRGGKGAARRVREGHKQACRKGPAEREKRVLGGAQGKGGSGPSVTKGTAERAGAHLSTGVRAVSTAGLISSTGHASRSAPHGLISAATHNARSLGRSIGGISPRSSSMRSTTFTRRAPSAGSTPPDAGWASARGFPQRVEPPPRANSSHVFTRGSSSRAASDTARDGERAAERVSDKPRSSQRTSEKNVSPGSRSRTSCRSKTRPPVSVADQR